MASKISRRRAGEEQESARPRKKARSSQNDTPAAQFDVFGASYAVERNEDMFALHEAIQLPAKIHSGHIRASVVDVVKYPNRKSTGLLLKLGPSRTDPEAPRLLECELMHPKALECQQPVYKDTVYVALTEAKVGINEKDEQLCFKLRFETSLIYIVPFERDNANSDGEPRILKLVDTGKNALQTRKNASAPPEKEQPGHVSVETESHSTSRPLPSAGIPAISHKTGRVRKRDTRHANNRQDSSNGLAGKVSRKLAKAAKKASLVTNTSPPVVAQIPSVPEGAEANSSPPPDSIEPPAVNAAGDAPTVSDDNQTVEVQRGEELPTAQEDKKTEPSRGGFVSVHGIKFLALEEIEGLPHRAPVSVVGVVESMGDPKPTRSNRMSSLAPSKTTKPLMRRLHTKEFLQVFRLSDRTRPNFRVQLFTRKLEWMPRVHVGQILLLHNAYVDIYQGAPMVVGPAAALRWIAYDPQAKKPFFSEDSTGPKYQYLDQKAKDYFATLADSRFRITSNPNHVVIVPRIGKHKLLSELKHHGTFFDATVEVLSVEHVSWGVEIFVTDYTRNDHFDINPNNSWGGVGRKRALRMEAWPAEIISYGAACLVKPGKFYLLKNFSFRETKNHGWAAKVLKQDNAEFRQVREDSQDPDLRHLIERKAAFDHEALDEVTEVSGVDEVYLGNPMDANRASSSEAKPVPVEELSSGHKIVCELMSPYTNLKAIKDDPRCHVEYKIRGRIVDITPSDPREMIQLYCANCEEILTTSRKEQARCSLCKSTTSFDLDVTLSLLVVDEADESLSVIVSGDEAKHLFGISSVNSNGNELSVESVAEDVVNKLRNVVGKLWVDGPCFKPFVNEGNAPQGGEIKVFSPWIDLAIRSWHVKDVDASSVHSSSWVRKYSLFKCIFQ